MCKSRYVQMWPSVSNPFVVKEQITPYSQDYSMFK
jgi:hypothetical protein